MSYSGSNDFGVQKAIDRQKAQSYMPDQQGEGSPIRVSGARVDPDMERILGLPIAPKLPPEFIQELNDTWVLDQAKRRGFQLWNEQVEAVYNYWNLGGGFCPIGCGFGKTYITFLCAHIAYQARGHKKGMLMMPPRLALKTRKDLIDAKSKISVSVPWIHLAGVPRRQRLRLAQSNRSGCYTFPYSFLQVPDTMELLESVDPDYLILDEAHKIKNLGAASVRRLMAWLRSRFEAGRPVEMVALSGTMTSKRLADYGHTITFCLGTGAPVPLAGHRLSEWDEVLDVDANSGGHIGPLAPMVRWAQGNFPDEDIPDNRSGFRKAYSLRLNSAPGVVGTGDREVGATLYVEPYDLIVPEKGEDESFDHLSNLRDVVVNAWLTPNGDEINHGMHLFKWEYELSSGFYNLLRWPTEDETMRKFHITGAEACDRLSRAKEWLDLRNRYDRLLRDWIADNPVPGCDTPMTVGKYMAEHGYLPNDDGDRTYLAWTAYHAAEFKGMPERISEPIRVCDFKVRQVCDWVQKLPAGEGAIVWVWHKALREWIVEELNKRGVPKVINGASGDPQVSDQILNAHGQWTDAIFVLQLGGYGEGHNMQYLRHMMYAQVPRQARDAEQTVARIHREGYLPDEFTAYFARGMQHDTITFQACVNDALYAHETLSTKQRLVTAEYPVALDFVPDEVLQLRVPDLKKLSPEEKQRFDFLFGNK